MRAEDLHRRASPVQSASTARSAILQTNEEMMRKGSIALGLIALSLAFSVGLCSWSTAPASAADFYILNVTRDNNVALLDPTTIVATQAGHKTFHLAQIDEYELWLDNTMEVDCTGKQMRKLSSVSHLAGGDTVKGLSSPGPWGKVGKERLASIFSTPFANGRIPSQRETRSMRLPI